MKKYFIPLLLIISINTFAINPPTGRATGVFLAFGVGPRLPLGTLSNSTELGYGLNVGMSYTDNEYLPFFIFLNVGFEQYPGSQSFYQETEHSNLATNSLPVNLGIRYFFSPVFEKMVLLMPVVEVSASFTYLQKLHEFKTGSGKSNYKEELTKFGITGGIGISMFLMEIMASYHYMENNQFISVDLRVRIPLYINL